MKRKRGRPPMSKARRSELDVAALLVLQLILSGPADTPRPRGARGRPRKSSGMTLEQAAEAVSGLFQAELVRQRAANLPPLVALAHASCHDWLKRCIAQHDKCDRGVSETDAARAYARLFGDNVSAERRAENFRRILRDNGDGPLADVLERKARRVTTK